MNVSAIRSDWVGRVVDERFPLLQWLGGSERSAVFLTEFTDGGRTRRAAIKLIPAEATDAEARLAGWQASANLSHPNVTQLFSTGACKVEGVSVLYAVTEYAEEVLADILTTRPLTPEETGEMLGPVLDALAWIHGKGLVHGRVNPSNILVVDDQLKLSGESLRVAGGSGNPSPSVGIYDAPESASGVLAPEADLWSLGVTLVETLTQRRPVAHADQQDDPVVAGNIPEPYATISRGCLRTDPARRFTIRDVRNALKIGCCDPDSAEETAGKVPALARLGILVVPLIVISAAFAVHEVSVHMRGPVAAPVASDQAQSIAVSSQQKPSAGTLASGAPEEPGSTPAPVAAQTPPTATQADSSPVSTPAEASTPTAPAPKTAEASPNGAVLSQVMPDILPAATSSIHGKFTVRVRVEVDPQGNVLSASYDSEGPSHYFAKQALDATQHWKFKPAPGPSQWIIQYVFRESGTEITTVPAN